ncbi:MarR family transcriptional regulator [Enterococcus faecium]|uniref:MarR family winged helix-turn-helix transcriptional regulator n=1 Tax=Listeria monocytogenes TaxID=1639 RepID=UPI0015742F08|nr:MarR family transcriptional regulator [Enterococcus faecium]NTM26040.1 MarR family transcriptional regulator [Enterococcus faecium]HAB9279725.1 MarR family transcriptional regulator [Listeria monocytogenes]HDT9925450.1 MarR family transcriptional regulator [Listeria monocytogenes]HEL8589914.1 MarR family transcriptional regulator [Listeria monocytogenes]
MEIQESLGFLLNTSARYIKKELDKQLKHYGITTSQWAILKLLTTENNLSQAEIANKVKMDRASCGTIIDKLLSKGLIEKHLFKNDRRSYRVRILPPTVKMVNEVTLLAEKTNELAVQGLTDSEKSVLKKCLTNIINNLGDEKDVLDN